MQIGTYIVQCNFKTMSALWLKNKEEKETAQMTKITGLILLGKL